MATAAKVAADYGYGARAPWAAFRASEYDMKERARLSGLFPQVNNEPLSNTLNALVEAFKKKRCPRRYSRTAPSVGRTGAVRLAKPRGDGRRQPKFGALL